MNREGCGFVLVGGDWAIKEKSCENYRGASKKWRGMELLGWERKMKRKDAVMQKQSMVTVSFEWRWTELEKVVS